MPKKNKKISSLDYLIIFECLMITCAKDINFVCDFLNVIDRLYHPFLADHIKNIYTEMNLNLIESELYKKL